MSDLPQRDASGKFVKKDSCEATSDPPLVHLRITNPVTYIKIWWKKVMSGEGIDFRFRVHPVTAFLMALAIALVAFGAGSIIIPAGIPFIENKEAVITKIPTPTVSPWRETALTGILKVTPNTSKYYLVTDSTEAVTLEIPGNVDLSKYVGKRILASGNYNKGTKTLVISDILDLEVLPQKPLPLVTFSPSPSVIPTEKVTPTVWPTIEKPPDPQDLTF